MEISTFFFLRSSKKDYSHWNFATDEQGSEDNNLAILS